MVRMIRNFLPLMHTVRDALEPYPDALKAVDAAVAAAAERPRNEAADVHVDEVENWAAHGWELADQGVKR